MSYELLISQFKGVSQSPDSDDHFEAALVTLLVLSKLDRTTNALTQLDLSLVLYTPSRTCANFQEK